MFPFVDELTADMLNESGKIRKNLIKRFFGNKSGFSDEQITYLMTAFECDIDEWLKKGQQKNPASKSEMINKLQKAGVNDSVIDWLISVWSEVVSKLYGITYEETTVEDSLSSNNIEAIAEEPEYYESVLDDEVSYVNPKVVDFSGRIYIPCGKGLTDRGFFIYGIEKVNFCEHPHANVYALVYNLMVRNTTISDEDIPLFLRERESEYELDYRSIYRMAIIILQMIKNNLIKNDQVNIGYKDRKVMEDAIDLINYYAAIFFAILKKKTYMLKMGNAKHSVNLTKKVSNGISIENNSGKRVLSREIWYGQKIRYNLTKDNLEDVECLLRIISPFKNFREGQYEALCNMLGTNETSICIMPTGSGKSLIFYMAAFMQPLPVFVVAPTDILIEDQIRNLKEIHHIDNVSHMMLTEKRDFNCFDFSTNINYITPITLQNLDVLQAFRRINVGEKRIKVNTGDSFVYKDITVCHGPRAAYFILDEIHCLSNWGHDFRPEYLMLSKYLHKFCSEIKLLGFTATANYTVIGDIQKQLNIPEKNIYSPLSYEKYNVTYNFRECKNTNEMYSAISEIIKPIINREERTLVFTKSDEISKKLADIIGYEADVFTYNNPTAYRNFLNENCFILVASEELGIGINFPGIKNIIHFGLPLSQNNYVQEIGRAGRANELVRSYVIFLENNDENTPPQLLSRKVNYEAVSSVINGMNNDYTETYKRITNGCADKNVLYNQLIEIIKDVDYNKRILYDKTIDHINGTRYRQLLYMLYVCGYFKDWYSVSYNRDTLEVDIRMEIFSDKTDKMLQHMREKSNEYFNSMGNDNRKACAKAGRAQSIEEIISVYIDWYYEEYLYKHNDEFVSMYEFVKNNLLSNTNKITACIKDYYFLPFVKIKEDEERYAELTLEQAVDKGIAGISSETVTNLERILSNKYYPNMEILLFYGEYRHKGIFDSRRFINIMENVDDAVKDSIMDSLPRMYGTGDINARLELVNFLNDENMMDEKSFLEEAYKNYDKDILYYAIMAKSINRYFA